MQRYEKKSNNRYNMRKKLYFCKIFHAEVIQ